MSLSVSSFLTPEIAERLSCSKCLKCLIISHIVLRMSHKVLKMSHKKRLLVQNPYRMMESDFSRHNDHYRTMNTVVFHK